MMEKETISLLVHSARNATALGRYNDATAILADALAQSPTAWEIRPELAFNYIHQGYLNSAISALDYFIRGAVPYPEKVRERDLVVFLYTCLNVRRTGVFPPAWEPCCKRIWEGHLGILTPGEDVYSETDVKLEILWHEAIYFARDRNGPCAGFDIHNPTTKYRLNKLHHHLSAVEPWHKQALHVARLLKKIWPEDPLVRTDDEFCDGYSLDGIATLLLLDGAFDDAEKLYSDTEHRHGQLDVHACRLQLRLSTASPQDMDSLVSLAHELVFWYDDIDYAQGSLFVLRKIVNWQDKHGLAYDQRLIERLDHLEAATGEIPLLKLPHYACLSISSSLGPLLSNLVPAFEDYQTKGDVSAEKTAGELGKASQSHHHPTALQPSEGSLGGFRSTIRKTLDSSLSKASAFLKTQLSIPEIDENDSRPLTDWELFKLALKTDIEGWRTWRHPSAEFLSDLEVLNRRMPPIIKDHAPEKARLLNMRVNIHKLDGLRQSTGSHSQTIQQAEAILQGFSPSTARSPQEWVYFLVARFKLARAHHATRNIDQAIKICKDTMGMKPHAPSSLRLAGVFKAMESFQRILEGEIEIDKKFEAARNGRAREGQEGLASLGHAQFAGPPNPEACSTLSSDPESTIRYLKNGLGGLDGVIQTETEGLAAVDSLQKPEVANALDTLKGTLTNFLGEPPKAPADVNGIKIPTVVKELPGELQRYCEFFRWAGKIPGTALGMAGRLVGLDLRLMRDYSTAISGSTGSVTPEWQMEALRSCAARFQVLQKENPSQSVELVDFAILGYVLLALGEFFPNEAIRLYTCSDSTARTPAKSRENFKAAIDLLEWSAGKGINAGALWRGKFHATLFNFIARTYQIEGGKKLDLYLLQRGLSYLEDAAAVTIRARRHQEPTYTNLYRLLEGRQRFAGDYGIVTLYAHGIDTYIMAFGIARDELEKSELIASCWKWIQRHKAASLSDLLSLDYKVLPSNLGMLKNYPAQEKLLQEECQIRNQLSRDDLAIDTCIRLHKDLNALEKSMNDHPLLREIVRDRDCDGMGLDDLVSLVIRAGLFDDDVAFIDWVISPDTGHIVMFCATCVMGQCNVRLEQIAECTISEVSEWIDQTLDHRVMSNADIAHNKLQKLTPLVQPITRLTKPGTLLVLCPTMKLHLVPLHALMVDDEQILLERNPVVYIPSFTVLHHLARVQEEHALISKTSRRQAAVISVYTSESPNSREPELVTDSLTLLANRFNTTLQSGSHVSVPFFKSHTLDCNIIHFYGHSRSLGGAETQALVLEHDGSRDSHTTTSAESDDRHLNST